MAVQASLDQRPVYQATPARCKTLITASASEHETLFVGKDGFEIFFYSYVYTSNSALTSFQWSSIIHDAVTTKLTTSASASEIECNESR